MRSAATLLCTLAALAPSLALAQATAPSPFRPPADLPRLRLNLGGPMEPSIALAVRSASGRMDPLLGPGFGGWRAVPELLFAFRPAPRVEIFGGGGAGAARVMPEPKGPEELDVAFSAELGVRFTWQRVPVTTIARAESIGGHGAAVTLSIRLDLDALGMPW